MADFERLFMGAPNEEHFGFCQGMRVGNTIYVSGQVGKDNTTGEMHAGDGLATKYENTVTNIRRIIDGLARGETSMVSVQALPVSCEPGDVETIAAQQRGLFGNDAPAFSITPIKDLARPDYLVEVSAVATEGVVVRVADESSWGEAVGGSAATKVGDTIYLSGHLPFGEDGEIAGETVGEQLTVVNERLQATLAEFDATLENCVSVQLWIAEEVSADIFEEVSAVNRRFYGAAKPTSTLVFAPSLPHGALAQIAAIAVTSVGRDE